MSGGPTPRVLLVGDVNLYGRTTGTQRRITATARGLAQVGTVDYLQWGSRSWRGRTDQIQEIDACAPLARHVVVRRRRVPDRLGTLHRMAWAARPLRRSNPGMPFAVTGAPVPSAEAVRRALGEQSAYDLVWCFEITSAVATQPLPPSVPMVVDVDAVPYLDREPEGDDRFTARDRRAWMHALDVVARRAEVLVLSNPVEAAQLRLPNVTVLPNGCEVPPFHGARSVGRPPVFVFVGWMGYEANADAALHLVTDIVPQIRATFGSDFVVRLVGTAPARIRRLSDKPNVEVAGYVDDLDAELGRADVAVVPIRRGAGTRIKVLEALAAQLPVVSTTFGAQGLEVVDGEHLLLADTPGDFAEACTRLVADPALRERLAAAGYEFVSSHHDWTTIESDVVRIASAAVRS